MDGRLDVLLAVATVGDRLVGKSQLEFFLGERLVVNKALHGRTSGVLQKVQLLAVLDTFSNDFEIEFVDHVHHVLYDNFVVVLVVADVIQEGLVELDDVDVQVLEGVERGITCAEVVNRYGNIVLTELVYEFLHGDLVFVIRGFGQFYLDVLAVDVVFLHDFKDVFGKVLIAQVQP